MAAPKWLLLLVSASCFVCLLCRANPLTSNNPDDDADAAGVSLDLQRYVSNLLMDESGETGFAKREGPSFSINQDTRHLGEVMARQRDANRAQNALRQMGKRHSSLSLSTPQKRTRLMLDLSAKTLLDSIELGRQREALEKLVSKGKRSVDDELY